MAVVEEVVEVVVVEVEEVVEVVVAMAARHLVGAHVLAQPELVARSVEVGDLVPRLERRRPRERVGADRAAREQDRLLGPLRLARQQLLDERAAVAREGGGDAPLVRAGEVLREDRRGPLVEDVHAGDVPRRLHEG